MSCGDWNDFEDPPVTKEMSLDEFVQRLTAQIEATKARADLATRLLCKVLKQIDGMRPVWYIRDPELVAWWAQHKKVDAKRKEKTIRCGRKVRRRR